MITAAAVLAFDQAVFAGQFLSGTTTRSCTSPRHGHLHRRRRVRRRARHRDPLAPSGAARAGRCRPPHCCCVLIALQTWLGYRLILAVHIPLGVTVDHPAGRSHRRRMEEALDEPDSPGPSPGGFLGLAGAGWPRRPPPASAFLSCSVSRPPGPPVRSCPAAHPSHRRSGGGSPSRRRSGRSAPTRPPTTTRSPSGSSTRGHPARADTPSCGPTTALPRADDPQPPRPYDQVTHTNNLPVPTVVHLHGGRTPHDSDGYPTDYVYPTDTSYFDRHHARAA